MQVRARFLRKSWKRKEEAYKLRMKQQQAQPGAKKK